MHSQNGISGGWAFFGLQIVDVKLELFARLVISFPEKFVKVLPIVAMRCFQKQFQLNPAEERQSSLVQTKW